MESKSIELLVKHHNGEINGTAREWYSFEVTFTVDGFPYDIQLVTKDNISKQMLINYAKKIGAVID